MFSRLQNRYPLQPKTKRNILFIAIGIVGLILLGYVAPDFDSDEPTLPAVSPSANFSLPLPPVGPRESSLNPFDQPFLFKLQGSDKMSGLEREQALQTQYHEILDNLSGRVPRVEVETLSGMTVVTIDERPFVTVLPADAPDYYQRLEATKQKELEQEIARQWQQLLILDLSEETYKRSPEYLEEFPYLVAGIFFLCLIGHALADTFSRRVLRSPGWSLKGFVWLFFFSIAAALHPHLKPLASAMLKSGLTPIFYLLIVMAATNLIYRIALRVLDRYVEAYIQSKSLEGDIGFAKRTDTLVQGGQFLIATILLTVATIWYLGSIGIDIGKLFAGAGIAGIALGVVGKDVLIDYFYGMNILLDNHFNIGDFIETPVAKGTVESFNLRTTRVRERDGGLSIVTNGRFTVIKNHSRDFAQTDFRVNVSYNCDIDQALSLVHEEILNLSTEQPDLLNPTPVFAGVEELGDNAVRLRFLVKTAALSQWAVGRELNYRVLKRFHQEGLEIPRPRSEVWLHNS